MFILPSQNPSFASGYAPRDGPHQHKNIGDFFAAYVPALGSIQLGGRLRDLRDKNHADIRSVTQPAVVGPDELSQFNQIVLKYTADVNNTELLVGDILDFRFLVAEPFSTVSCFSFTTVDDERALINKFGATNRRQYMVRINTSRLVEIYHAGTAVFLISNTALDVNTWYTVIVTSNGDDTDSNGLVLRIYTKDGALLKKILKVLN